MGRVVAFFAGILVSKAEEFGRYDHIQEIGVTTGISIKKNFDQERSRYAARMIEQAMVDALRASSEEAINIIDTCRLALLADSSSEVERLEVARRIAEVKVSILYEKEGAKDDFLASWAEIESLGYSSPEREASMLFYFVKFNERLKPQAESNKECALDRLGVLIGEMEASGENNLASHFRSVYSKLCRPSP